MKFKTRAVNYRYKLTETEEDLVEYILTHQTEVAQMRIWTLAKRFFPVPNTITRFCH